MPLILEAVVRSFPVKFEGLQLYEKQNPTQLFSYEIYRPATL